MKYHDILTCECWSYRHYSTRLSNLLILFPIGLQWVSLGCHTNRIRQLIISHHRVYLWLHPLLCRKSSFPMSAAAMKNYTLISVDWWRRWSEGDYSTPTDNNSIVNSANTAFYCLWTLTFDCNLFAQSNANENDNKMVRKNIRLVIYAHTAPHTHLCDNVAAIFVWWSKTIDWNSICTLQNWCHFAPKRCKTLPTLFTIQFSRVNQSVTVENSTV